MRGRRHSGAHEETTTCPQSSGQRCRARTSTYRFSGGLRTFDAVRRSPFGGRRRRPRRPRRPLRAPRRYLLAQFLLQLVIVAEAGAGHGHGHPRAAANASLLQQCGRHRGDDTETADLWRAARAPRRNFEAAARPGGRVPGERTGNARGFVVGVDVGAAAGLQMAHGGGETAKTAATTHRVALCNALFINRRPRVAAPDAAIERRRGTISAVRGRTRRSSSSAHNLERRRDR